MARDRFRVAAVLPASFLRVVTCTIVCLSRVLTILFASFGGRAPDVTQDWMRARALEPQNERF